MTVQGRHNDSVGADPRVGPDVVLGSSRSLFNATLRGCKEVFMPHVPYRSSVAPVVPVAPVAPVAPEVFPCLS